MIKLKHRLYSFEDLTFEEFKGLIEEDEYGDELIEFCDNRWVITILHDNRTGSSIVIIIRNHSKNDHFVYNESLDVRTNLVNFEWSQYFDDHHVYEQRKINYDFFWKIVEDIRDHSESIYQGLLFQ